MDSKNLNPKKILMNLKKILKIKNFEPQKFLIKIFKIFDSYKKNKNFDPNGS